MKKSILLLLFVCSFTACSMTRWKGTDTGNPDQVRDPVSGDSGANNSNPTDPAALVASKICSKLQTCFAGSDQTNCMDSVLMVAGLAPHLGYFSRSTLNDVLNDMMKNVDSTKLVLCSTELDAISCVGAPMSSSYNSGMSGNYSSVGNLFSATQNCSSVGF
ncbi:MAG: hypothetical protein RJB66_2628 [Pseudomonadota bacterium]